MTYREAKQRLLQWFKDLQYNMPNDVFDPAKNISEEEITNDGKTGKMTLLLFTEVHRYTIFLAIEKKVTVLSCMAELRKPLVGQNWTTGLMLAQGTFSISIFHEIIKDIVGNELVQLETESGSIEKLEDKKPEEESEDGSEGEGSSGKDDSGSADGDSSESEFV